MYSYIPINEKGGLMKKLSAAGLVLASMILPAGAEELTFPSAVDLMLQSNQELQAAKKEVTAKEYDRKAAFGLYFPVVSVSSMYTHLRDPLTLDLNPVRNAIAKLTAPGYEATFGGVAQAEAGHAAGNVEHQIDVGIMRPLAVHLRADHQELGRPVAAVTV